MNELEWLTERRPKTTLDEAVTTRARAALLEHVGEETRGEGARSGAGRGGEVAPSGAGRRDVPGRRARGGADARRAGVFALAVAVTVAVIVALPGGDGPARIGAPEEAVAAPLVRLAARIQAAPAPPGDATLVLREHDFPTAEDFTGADLYLDDGRYFYAPTRAGLHGAVAQEPQGQRQIAAAKAALELPDEQARTRMIDATLAPGTRAASSDDAVARRKREAIAARKRLPGPTPTPAPQRLLDDNRVWMGSTDALMAGVGRADVRAGVMKLLATVPDVKVTERGDTVEIRNAGYPDRYVETLTVDARTGVLRRMIGGTAGRPPEVVVTYDIQRVKAADILK